MCIHYLYYYCHGHSQDTLRITVCPLFESLVLWRPPPVGLCNHNHRFKLYLFMILIFSVFPTVLSCTFDYFRASLPLLPNSLFLSLPTIHYTCSKRTLGVYCAC